MPALVPHDGITGPSGEPVYVRRSARRRRTVSITRRDGALEVAIPATMSRRDEARWVRTMVERITAQEARRRPRRSDDELARRAERLSALHFDGRARPSSVTWSIRQNTRWGSCTPADGTIRISARLQEMPSDVLDYVLVHELAHLFEGGHGPEFWALVNRYPGTERARGFLDGVSWAQHHGGDTDGGAIDGTDPDGSDPDEAASDVD